MDKNKEEKNLFYAISLGLELGFLIVIPIVSFLVLGLALDKWLGTLPLLLVIFTILSLAATFFNVRYLILPFLEKRSQDKIKNKK